MKRRLMLLALSLALVLGTVSGALAQALKDEVVYARLDAQGAPLGVWLVNAFEAREQTRVLDYGAYEQAWPLGEATDFAYQDGEASFTMAAGRFSYQGDLPQAQLPWTFDLAYTLDGQPVSAQALSGASGQLAGSIRVRINEDLRHIADSLSLQITLSLDEERCLDIRSDKATHAIAGGARTLSFVVLPGQEADVGFSARVTDFAMPGIQIAGVRMGIDAQMYQDAAAAALAGSPLEGAVSGLMANFLSGMEGQPVSSFADPRNQVRSLQFVLLGEQVKAKEFPPEPESEPGPQTFWQRFLNIFGR
ncbi:MAG: hypothetical protein GXY84_02555 [Clostridiales bacterium]|nr:hypothetical protein [Clostridiales bacterium]